MVSLSSLTLALSSFPANSASPANDPEEGVRAGGGGGEGEREGGREGERECVDHDRQLQTSLDEGGFLEVGGEGEKGGIGVEDGLVRRCYSKRTHFIVREHIL